MMNIEFIGKIPVLSLVALLLSYALLGWYLSAYHIFWLVGACVAGIALAISWKSLTWLERLVRFSSRGLFVILILLVISVLFALVTSLSVLIPIVLMPIITMVLAEVEMRFTGIDKGSRLCFLIILAGFALGLGEIIDILLLPSNRY